MKGNVTFVFRVVKFALNPTLTLEQKTLDARRNEDLHI